MFTIQFLKLLHWYIFFTNRLSQALKLPPVKLLAWAWGLISVDLLYPSLGPSGELSTYPEKGVWGDLSLAHLLPKLPITTDRQTEVLLRTDSKDGLIKVT